MIGKLIGQPGLFRHYYFKDCQRPLMFFIIINRTKLSLNFLYRSFLKIYSMYIDDHNFTYTRKKNTPLNDMYTIFL